MRHLKDLDVLILGLGASGLAMARWCARHGARVTVADTREAPPQLASLRAALPDAAFVAGPFGASLVEGTPVRAVYRSPGLSPASLAPVLDAARAIGLAVGGELDLFARALADLGVPDGSAAVATPALQEVPVEAESASLPEPAASADEREGTEEGEGADAASPALEEDEETSDGEPAAPIVIVPPEPPKGYAPAVLAITGTNGKTTVTSLTGILVERAGKSVAVAGNIGPTLLDTLAARMDADALPEVWVLELSSFQLDGVQGFEPTAAAVLNLTQDHLTGTATWPPTAPPRPASSAAAARWC